MDRHGCEGKLQKWEKWMGVMKLKVMSSDESGEDDQTIVVHPL